MGSKKEVDQAEKLRSMYKAVFNSPAGRIVLNDMMVNAGFFRSSYQQKDAHGTSYFEGRRSLVLDIINLLSLEKSKDFLQDTSDMQESFNKQFSL